MTTIRTVSVDKDGLVRPVSVEVSITKGIGIHLIGLADQAVKESLLRVVTAIQNLGYHFPGKKVIVNLAPADLHKNGTGYDLPIALGILAESGQIQLKEDILSCTFYGELGLDATIRPTGDEDKILDVIRGGRENSECLVMSSMACKLMYSSRGLIGFSDLAWLLRYAGK